MASCPNCGRQTARTKDWCCQWCGYPLFSGSFKMLDKTYKELKAERLGQEAVKEDAEEQVQSEPVETPAAETVINEPAVQPEPVADPEPEIETVETEPVTRIVRRVRKVRRPQERPVRRIIRRRRPGSDEIEEIVEYIEETPASEEVEYYDDDSEIEDEYDDDVEYEDDDYEDVEPEPEPRRVVRRPEVRKPARRKPVEPVAEEPEEEEIEEPEAYDEEDEYEEDYDESSEPDEDDGEDAYDESYTEDDEDEEIVPAVPEVREPAMSITVEDIVSAYETEGDAADARYANKVLQVTGIIQKVEVKEAMSVYALILEAEETYTLRQTVRCVFDPAHGSVLSTLVPAQNVTVLGKYDGSIINISMRDCELVGGPE